MNIPGKKFSIIETIEFHGHPNILGTHRNTIEVTKDAEISKRGDCIVGVNASKASADLSQSLKQHIQSGGRLSFLISVNTLSFTFQGKGRKELDLTNQHELVFRRSEFPSDRTVAISCDFAAIDIPRKMITALQSRNTQGFLAIRALDFQASEIDPTPMFIES